MDKIRDKSSFTAKTACTRFLLEDLETGLEEKIVIEKEGNRRKDQKKQQFSQIEKQAAL